MTNAASERKFPEFSLARLLRTVFDPAPGQRIGILIDLEEPEDVKDFAFLKKPGHEIQRHAYEVFYQGLQQGTADALGLTGGELYAYQVTGGSNLDLPDRAVTPAGKEVSLEKDVYPHYDILLCISTYSATAPLTAFAKQYGFRGATMHGINDTILKSGLCVDYDDVSRDAEKLRLGLTRADAFEIDFEFLGRKTTLKLITDRQEAQKSHGLCRGKEPDVANLPAGEVYFVPHGAEGQFPLQYEDGTIGLMDVKDGRIQRAALVKGNANTVEAHNRKLKADPLTGEIGELGLGTQVLPFSGSDIQDEKILGTVHVATGRSDHLGGDLTPDRFAESKNATHDDILFAPPVTPDIHVSQVRMKRQGKTEVIIEDFQPSAYLRRLLEA